LFSLISTGGASEEAWMIRTDALPASSLLQPVISAAPSITLLAMAVLLNVLLMFILIPLIDHV
jgi:hypothetical protein